jgi:CubicO group peptidase (beta-lactamase class C family)
MKTASNINQTFPINSSRLQLAFDRAKISVQNKELPSALVAVANDHEIIRCEAYSRPDSDQITTDSIFLLGSISKPLLATAVMQLVEAGKLVLTEPVTRYIPEFAQPDKAPVTAWHLLTHTSGMEEKAWNDALGMARVPREYFTMAALRSNLHFTPGARYKYCTLSFVVLAELVQRLSGMPYEDYLQQHIFAPLGMNDTTFEPAASKLDRAVKVHNIKPDDFSYVVSLHSPGGGLWSTAADLVKFGQAFLHQGLVGDYHLISPSFIRMMTQDHVLGLTETQIDGRITPAHYGLGWGKRGPEHPASTAGFGHNGITGTTLWIDPEWNLIYVFLTNHWEAETYVSLCVQQAVYSALRRD